MQFLKTRWRVAEVGAFKGRYVISVDAISAVSVALGQVGTQKGFDNGAVEREGE